jgi:hypothetical protein
MQLKRPPEFNLNGHDLLLADWSGKNKNALKQVSVEHAQELADEVYKGNATKRQTRQILRWLYTFQAVQIERAIARSRTFIYQSHIMLGMEDEGIRDLADSDDLAAVLKAREEELDEGSLLLAIIVSLKFVLLSRADWIVCKHCGRLFKYSKEYRPKVRYKPAVYCKSSCRVMDSDKDGATVKTTVSVSVKVKNYL